MYECDQSSRALPNRLLSILSLAGRRLAQILAVQFLLIAPTAIAAGLYDWPDAWVDDHQAGVRLGDFRGREVVMTMAYSSCGRICAVTLRSMEDIQQRADEQHRAVEFVIVGYNPDLDTPRAWANYRRSRHLQRDNWHFLSGSSESTHRLARYLGIDYWLYEEHVMHDFKIVRLDAHGDIVRSINWDERTQALF